ISATRDGHVYAVSLFGSSISYMDSYGSSTDLGAPNGSVAYGYGNSVAASVGRSGQNEVFALGGQNAALYVNSANAPGQWRLVDGQVSFKGLSATANDTVFALSYGNAVYQETEQYNPAFKFYYWTRQQISPSWEQCWAISADIDGSGQDEVYVIDSNQIAYLGNKQGSWTWKDSDVYDIAGADGGYFYDVNYYG